MTRVFLLPLALLLFSLKAYSQDSLFKPYRPGLAVSDRSFSMDIPHSWKEMPGQDAFGYFQTFLETDSTVAVVRVPTNHFKTPPTNPLKTRNFAHSIHNTSLMNTCTHTDLLLTANVRPTGYYEYTSVFVMPLPGCINARPANPAARTHAFYWLHPLYTNPASRHCEAFSQTHEPYA